MLVFFLLFQLAAIFSNIWLSEWTSDPVLMNATLSNTSLFANRQTMYLGVFGAVAAAEGTTVTHVLIQVYLRYTHQCVWACLTQGGDSREV